MGMEDDAGMALIIGVTSHKASYFVYWKAEVGISGFHEGEGRDGRRYCKGEDGCLR